MDMINNFVDALLDALDSMDVNTLAMKMAKQTILATIGFEAGNHNPITKKDIESFFSLRNDYFQAVHKGHQELADSLRTTLFEVTIGLINRCFTSNNAYLLSGKLRKRWNM